MKPETSMETIRKHCPECFRPRVLPKFAEDMPQGVLLECDGCGTEEPMGKWEEPVQPGIHADLILFNEAYKMCLRQLTCQNPEGLARNNIVARMRDYKAKIQRIRRMLRRGVRASR